MGLFIVLLVVLVPLIYVRAAPTDPARWHKAASQPGIEIHRGEGSFIWRAPVAAPGTAELQKLATAAAQEPRTRQIAGDVSAGQVTYMSRSRIFGFPDYTTLGVYTTDTGETYLEAYGRLRFGLKDMGVNARRIKGWVAAAGL